MRCARITVTKDDHLVAVFEQGQWPTYHADGQCRETVEALVGSPERVPDGLPVDEAIARLVGAGFTLTCRATFPGHGRT